MFYAQPDDYSVFQKQIKCLNMAVRAAAHNNYAGS